MSIESIPSMPDPLPEPEELDLDGEIECWCGAKGTYDQLFDDDHLDARCGGTGSLSCHCGGDLCVCHNHGEVECPGCPDCEGDDDHDDFDQEPLD